MRASERENQVSERLDRDVKKREIKKFPQSSSFEVNTTEKMREKKMREEEKKKST